MSKVLVIVPAFNEAGNVGLTVAEIRRHAPGVDILVVDDCSSDETIQEASQAGAWVVSLPVNLGIGGAVQTGFRFAHERSYDIVVQIDGDGQHDASFLKDLTDVIERGQAEMAIGSRFIDKSGFQSTLSRRIGIIFFVHLINHLTGVRISDPTSGFRAINKRLIAVFADHYPQDFPEPEAIVVAQRLKARIAEVPVKMRKRQSGHSSIGYVRSLYYMVKVTLAILLNMIRRAA